MSEPPVYQRQTQAQPPHSHRVPQTPIDTGQTLRQTLSAYPHHRWGQESEHLSKHPAWRSKMSAASCRKPHPAASINNSDRCPQLDLKMKSRNGRAQWEVVFPLSPTSLLPLISLLVARGGWVTVTGPASSGIWPRVLTSLFRDYGLLNTWEVLPPVLFSVLLHLLFATSFHIHYLSWPHNNPVRHLAYKETGSEGLSDRPKVT